MGPKILAVTGLLFVLALSSISAGAERRNIVLIVADDLGRELGCYGNSNVRTPHIDALAQQGTRFSSGFATVSSCSPSRAVMLTGLFTHSNGQYGLAHDVHHSITFSGVRSVPMRLKQAGYKTAVIGKLHVLPPEVYTFDVNISGREVGSGKDVDGMADKVGEFVAATSEPFFLLVGFTDPHRAGKGYGSEGKLDIPSERYQPDDVIVPPFLPDIPAVRRDLAEYYQAITRLDRGVGLVMDVLSRAKISGETLVIFVSDNGMPFPGAKTSLYDASVRLPLIVSSPKQSRRGITNDSLVSWIDLAPTMLEWAGAKSNGLPGESLLPLLDAEHAGAERKAVFGSHVQHEVTMYYPMRSIRTGTHHYILNLAHELEFPCAGDLFRSPTWQAILKDNIKMLGQRPIANYLHRPREELYDLQNDANEMKNVAADPAYAGVLDDLRNRLKAWQVKTNDPWRIKYEHE